MEEPDSTPTEEPSPTDETPVEESTDESSPPWGEDFDAQRAWNTLQNLRGEEKELKQRVRELETPWTDEEVFRAIASERYGYEFEDEQDDEYEDDEPQFVTREELEQREAQRDALAAEQAFNQDLTELVSEADLELRPGDYHELYAACMQSGADFESLKGAVANLAKERKEYDTQVIERYRNSKSGPFVSPVGSSATEKPDLDDDQERQKWMAQRWMNAQQQ